MSSILTALKKLENESAPQKVVYSGSRRRGIRYTSSKKTGFLGRYKNILLVFVIIGIVSVAGWSAFERHSLSVLPHTEVIENAEMNKSIKSHMPEPYPAESKGLSPHLSYSPVETASQKNADVTSPSTPNKQAPTPTPRDSQGSLSESEVKKSTPISPSILEWKDTDRLKLQAIAWSPNPDKRIAALNNRIIREGDLIGGIKVENIHEDKLIISESGQLYQLLFR